MILQHSPNRELLIVSGKSTPGSVAMLGLVVRKLPGRRTCFRNTPALTNYWGRRRQRRFKLPCKIASQSLLGPKFNTVAGASGLCDVREDAGWRNSISSSPGRQPPRQFRRRSISRGRHRPIPLACDDRRGADAPSQGQARHCHLVSVRMILFWSQCVYSRCRPICQIAAGSPVLARTAARRIGQAPARTAKCVHPIPLECSPHGDTCHLASNTSRTACN